MEFDLVLRAATVVDGGGGPARTADVGVHGGRITAVGDVPASAPAARTIDARHLVVCPGFIDIHTHSDVSVLRDPAGESKVRQGVTTEIVGNCGFSAFPVAPERAALHHEHLAGIEQDPPRPTWTDLDGYAAALGEQGVALNVGALAGHGALRIAAMGVQERAADAEDLARMCQLVDEAMAQGAFGISTGLTYVPSGYGTVDEIARLAQVAAGYGGIYATHARATVDTGAADSGGAESGYGGEFGAVEEAVEIGRRSGAFVEFSHVAINDPRRWGRAAALLGAFERGRAAGVDIAFDVYPYDASSSALTQYLPTWVQNGGHAAMATRLQEPEVRRRAVADLARGWYGGIPWHWDRVVVSQAPAGESWCVGRSLADSAAHAGVSPAQLALELCERNGNEVKVVLHYRTEEDMLEFLRHPLAVVGSDGSAIPLQQHGDRPHPRNFGTFPRVLGRYVRERGALGLAEAVHKMTGLPARRLGLRERGLVAEGLVADLVAFDPVTVADRATFVDPCQPPAGIEYVLVAGVPVLDGGVPTRARPGRLLRRGAS
jgi:N-acyl-D-aspartate/D-glutamate deacylase